MKSQITVERVPILYCWQAPYIAPASLTTQNIFGSIAFIVDKGSEFMSESATGNPDIRRGISNSFKLDGRTVRQIDVNVMSVSQSRFTANASMMAIHRPGLNFLLLAGCNILTPAAKQQLADALAEYDAGRARSVSHGGTPLGPAFDLQDEEEEEEEEEVRSPRDREESAQRRRLNSPTRTRDDTTGKLSTHYVST